MHGVPWKLPATEQSSEPVTIASAGISSGNESGNFFSPSNSEQSSSSVSNLMGGENDAESSSFTQSEITEPCNVTISCTEEGLSFN